MTQPITDWLKRTKRDDAQYITWQILGQKLGRPISSEEVGALVEKGWLQKLVIIHDEEADPLHVDWDDRTCVDPNEGTIIPFSDDDVVFAAGALPDIGSEYVEPVDKDARPHTSSTTGTATLPTVLVCMSSASWSPIRPTGR